MTNPGFDYAQAFARALCEEMDETFSAHGIDAIHEDTLDSVAQECNRRVYLRSIAEFQRAYGIRPLVEIGISDVLALLNPVLRYAAERLADRMLEEGGDWQWDTNRRAETMASALGLKPTDGEGHPEKTRR